MDLIKNLKNSIKKHINHGTQAFYKVMLCLSRRAVQAKYIKDGDLCKTLAKFIVVHSDRYLTVCNIRL